MKLVITKYFVPLGYEIPYDNEGHEIEGEFEFYPNDSGECIKDKYLRFVKNFDTHTYRIEMSNEEFYVIPMNNCWVHFQIKTLKKLLV